MKLDKIIQIQTGFITEQRPAYARDGTYGETDTQIGVIYALSEYGRMFVQNEDCPGIWSKLELPDLMQHND